MPSTVGASFISAFIDKYGYLSEATGPVKDDLVAITRAMLTVNPKERPSARQLLESDFFTQSVPLPCPPQDLFMHVAGKLPDQLNE